MPPQRLMHLALPLYRRRRAAAGGGGAVRRRLEGRAALAQPRLHAHPALGDHEDRHAADAGLVLPEARGHAAAARLGGRRRSSCCCRWPSSPGSRTWARRSWSRGRLLRHLPAGLSWKVLATLVFGGLASLPFAWTLLHDYQRQRILTLIDPEADPLGKGFHIIQSTIAVGSGGMFGKGWGNGTQTHLEFIPERHTDFIFAVLSEEFGLLGNSFLLVLYALIIGRGLMIAANAPTLFSRLLAGSVTLIFFTYAFVNMGMVSGILPVVGVPLPFVSYGGTALVTLFAGVGILMSIHKHRMLVQK
jgi:hypothetical protein